MSLDRTNRLLSIVIVLALVGVGLGLMLVQRIGTTYRDGLSVTRDGSDVAALSAGTASDLAADVSTLARTAAQGLVETRTIILLAAESTGDVGLALGDNLADGVSGTANIADGLAGLIESIERLIPGDSESLAEDLRVLADGLEPVPDQLRELGAQLVDTSAGLLVAAESVTSIAAQLRDLAASVEASRAALIELQKLSNGVAASVDDALQRSSTDLWLLRLVVIVIGVIVAGAARVAQRAIRAGGGT